MMNSETPIIDLSHLHKLLNGKREQINQMTELLIDFVPSSITEAKLLVNQRDWVTLKKKVHTMKSNYGYLGNDALIQMLVEWEGQLLSDPENFNHQQIVCELEARSELIVTSLKNSLLENE